MALVDDVKEFLRIDSEDTANDAIITSLINAAKTQLSISTGMTAAEIEAEPLAVTCLCNLVRLWYDPDNKADNITSRTERVIAYLLASLQHRDTASS